MSFLMPFLPARLMNEKCCLLSISFSQQLFTGCSRNTIDFQINLLTQVFRKIQFSIESSTMIHLSVRLRYYCPFVHDYKISIFHF